MVFLFWSACKEPWPHPRPFFHHICQPGSTRFDSAQRNRWWKSKLMRPALTWCSQIVPVEKQHMSQTQDQWWTSLKLLCLNGNKSLQQVRHAVERLIPEERRLTHWHQWFWWCLLSVCSRCNHGWLNENWAAKRCSLSFQLVLRRLD